MLKKFFATLTMIVLLVSPVLAGSVTVTWDHNDPMPEGYMLFVREEGQSYDYANPDWTGPENRTTVELTEGTLYYFVVRAYEGVLQSPDSLEINYVVPTTGIDPVGNTRIDRVIIINVN